jgi:voltage-gated potassium channel
MPLAAVACPSGLPSTRHRTTRYARLKGFFHKLLTDPRSRRRLLFDSFMIVLVLASVMLLIYEVRHPLGAWADTFEAFVVSGVRG